MTLSTFMGSLIQIGYFFIKVEIHIPGEGSMGK
jgi:hypothetical protein